MNHPTNTPPTLWAYESPAKHQHRPSGWQFVDNEINGELVLVCPRCDATWHTGLPADDDYHEVRELVRAAAAWLAAEWFSHAPRRQLTLPLLLPDTTLHAPTTKRRYTTSKVVDLSAQLALPLAA